MTTGYGRTPGLLLRPALGRADLDHAAALLREVGTGPRRAVELAQPIAADIRWRYRPAAIASAFRAAVEDPAALPPRDRRSTQTG